jgi:hypothetical protein
VFCLNGWRVMWMLLCVVQKLCGVVWCVVHGWRMVLVCGVDLVIVGWSVYLVMWSSGYCGWAGSVG